MLRQCFHSVKLPRCFSAHTCTISIFSGLSQPLFTSLFLKGVRRAMERFHRGLPERRWSCCQCINTTAAHCCSGGLHVLARHHDRVGLNPASPHCWVPCYLLNFQIEVCTFCPLKGYFKTKDTLGPFPNFQHVALHFILAHLF